MMVPLTKRNASPQLKDNERITLKEAEECELMLPFGHGMIRDIGMGWFKDMGAGTYYHLVKNGDGEISISEVRQGSDTGPVKTKGKSTSNKSTKTHRVDITCVDCGATRSIANQDVFQVKRCVECQLKYKRTRRLETARLRREKRLTQKEENPQA